MKRSLYQLVWISLIGFLLVKLPGAEPLVLPVWPGVPPDETLDLGSERDTTTESSEKVAGQRVIRLTDVRQPTLTVYSPEASVDTGASVLICPGGGHQILAMDLEGTEVAQWLNRIGVTGILLKYRVPARHKDSLWKSAVQDAQRSMRLMRAHAAQWRLDPDRMGILGFSAGGQTAVISALTHQKVAYEPLDAIDDLSARPDFGILVYPAWLVDATEAFLKPEVQVDASAPPMFFAHANDDPISPQNSILLFQALQKAGVSAELHLYDGGGHGFGLGASRFPASTWPESAERWMRLKGILP